MRVLVTGGLGFMGTAVTRRLVMAGHEVVALTHRPPQERTPAAHAMTIVQGDVRDAEAIRAAVRDVDAVCHLAALARVRESFEREDEYWQVNVTGTDVVLEALTSKATVSGRPMWLVHASTHAIYGAPAHERVGEDTPAAPMSPYGASKAAAEGLVLAAARSGLVGAVCLRLFNAAGAVDGTGDTDETRLIPKAIAVAAGRAPALPVNGDGAAVRDYVHVDDAARAFTLAIDACEPGACKIYNVGGTPASVREVITIAEQVTDRTIQVINNPPKPEPQRIVADTAAIRRELSWAPERSSLTEIIADAWQAANARGR